METLRGLAALFGQSMDALCGDDPAPGPEAENLSVMTRAFRQLTPEEQAQLIEVGRSLFAHAFSLEDEP